MRILQINETLEKRGGQERYFYDLSNALKKAGHEVKLWAPRPEPSFIKRQISRFIIDFRTFNELRGLIDDFKPDIVHLHGINRSTNSILIACDISNVVMTVHNYGLICPTLECVYRDNEKICSGGVGWHCVRCIDSIQMLMFRRHFKSRKRWLDKVVKKFISPSQRLKNYLEVYGYDNVVQVPYFIDLKEVTTKPKKKTIDVLYVGRLDYEKGVNYLIKAVDLIKPLKVKIVGDGPARKDLEEFAEQLGVKIDFVGKVPFTKVKQYYARAKLVVIPSIYMDNFPIVGLEALANGIPVIGGDRGGIKEYASLVFKDLNVWDLADIILKILVDQKLWNKLSKEAKQKAKQFNKKARLNDILKIYKEVSKC